MEAKGELSAVRGKTRPKPSSKMKGTAHVVSLALMNEFGMLFEVLISPEAFIALTALKWLVLLVGVSAKVSLEVRIASKV